MMKIKKVDYAWVDGKYLEWDKAKVHMMTHALHYGTGVIEGIRGYPSDNNLNIFRLREHLLRLVKSASMLMINIPYSIDELSTIITSLLKKNHIRELCYIRPIIFQGALDLDVVPSDSSIRCAIFTFPLGTYLEKKGLKVCTSSWRKIPDDCIPSLSKTCGAYLNSYLARSEALRNGYDESILINTKGYIAEAPGENIFLVKDKIVYTPPLSANILEGITRRSIIELSTHHGYRLFETDLLKSDLYRCDEAFFTGTAAEISPIIEVDGRLIGEGKIGRITKKIQKTFSTIIQGKIDRFSKWLTPVY